MATKVFLTSGASDLTATQTGLTGHVHREALLVPGSGLTVGTTDSATVPVLATEDTAADAPYVWLTKPLDAVTISALMTFNQWAAESNMSANFGSAFNVVWANANGVALGTILNSGKGVELPVTTRAAQNWTGTPGGSTTLAAGDRIRIQVQFNTIGAGASGFTMTLGFAGVTGGADGDTWVQFTETITEVTAATSRPRRRDPMAGLIQRCERLRPYWRREHGIWLPDREILVPA